MTDTHLLQRSSIDNLSGFLDENYLNQKYVTNRVLEIPQNIKLEFDNGTVTLKAGSKVYDGLGGEHIVPSDMSFSSAAGGATKQIMLIKTDFSTAIFSANYDTNLSYNSTTGLVDYTGLGSYYLPVSVTIHSGSTYTGIESIFNGFGYIGSYVFVLPGVKVQVPNGKNKDGTYAYTVYTNTSVSVTEGSYNLSNFNGSVVGGAGWGRSYRFISVNNKKDIPTTFQSLIQSENVVYQNVGGTLYRVQLINLADYTITGGRITSFTPCNVDCIANSNASNFSQIGRSYLSGLSMPSTTSIDLIGTGVINSTITTTHQSYIAPANGYIYIANTSATEIVLTANGLATRCGIAAGASLYAILWVSEGSVVEISTLTGSTTLLFCNFRYATGEN